jgi:hypothetical protein
LDFNSSFILYQIIIKIQSTTIDLNEKYGPFRGKGKDLFKKTSQVLYCRDMDYNFEHNENIAYFESYNKSKFNLSRVRIGENFFRLLE